MNSLDALEEFKSTIQFDSSVANFCCKEQNWIQSREENWKLDKIRVGVVGVTSSGKSTLINAILGENILTSAVAPSSGQLVCCSYGELPEIVVHFEDGTTKKFSGKKFSSKNLELFSDERKNPRNKQGVLSIELTSPRFDLGEDILLVDSPGLDAFGLESHEKLTLESLVPTIDACIYVTTMKTNSDRKTKEILDIVARYNCPIIIVQNMLDSVRPSVSGDKSSKQVALDHKKRIQHIIENSEIHDKSSVCIIQMSAEYARQWRTCHNEKRRTVELQIRFEKSNYDSFVESVTAILEQKRPQIEHQRLKVVFDQIKGLIDEVEEKLKSPTSNIQSIFPYQSLKDQFYSSIKDYPKRNEEIFKLYAEKCQHIHDAIQSSSIWSLESDIDIYLDDTNTAVNEFEKELISLISDFNQFIASAADTLNIPKRDLANPTSILHTFRNIAAEKTIKTERIAIEKGGIFGGRVARFFGSLFDTDWGYEYETREETVTDVEATIKKINQHLKNVYDRYSQTMKTWFDKTFTNSMNLIQKEIDDLENGYLQQKRANVQTNLLSILKQRLMTLLHSIDANGELSKSTQFSVSESILESVSEKQIFTNTKKLDVGDYEGSMLNMAYDVLYDQHRTIAKKFVQTIGCSNHSPIIIGWDEGSKNEFLHLTGIKDAEIISSPNARVHVNSRGNKCVFVLVNTIQFGEALKQILELNLKYVLNNKDYVVWVVQDFQELMAGDNVVEGLNNMLDLSSQTNIPCQSMVYLLHNNPIYNLAFIEYQLDPTVSKTPERLINELQGKYKVFTSEKECQLLGAILRKVHKHS